MTDTLRIHRANPEPAVAEGLADVLLDCVEGGASVSFMHPLPRAKALAFWQDALASTARTIASLPPLGRPPRRSSFFLPAMFDHFTTPAAPPSNL